ncbi:poly-beta-1,6 N-acetyl-D-glucosamine export porin PgaA [Enterobacter sp. Cy-643]|uniref:poly-beta-1,6 N-acetyl-D-glucosamine export porin PgaA n=1 Tax=Enterobacter sp. Cy-643 TaxID=2608346 RepID=UPI00141EFD72|nr:poly-beta-1,6 N-acetyl-D-glucosamine export porin PgaA [Enterobacter sp. Cy-643]NIF31983.1 poly-beta-1,6 N-acetyl-D-glucosamine export porin PgaA [Enterobacter sp. Cy-643]
MEQRLSINKLFFYRGVKLSLFLIMPGLLPAQGMGATSRYDSQVLQARNGDYQPLLAALEHEAQQRALNPGQVADWLQVASWAGRDNEVVSVWQRYRGQTAIPARGVAAAAQSLRNLHRWTESLSLWEQALRLSPANDDYRTGRIKTLADGQKAWQARDEALRLVEEKPTLAHWQTLSYVYLRQGKTWDQLLSDTRALALAPADKIALQNLISSLTVNRVNTPALALARQAHLPANERRTLELNALAEKVRMAEISPGEEKARFTVAQRALDRYDALLARWRGNPQARQDVTRARIDRLGALYAHNYYPKVIQEYEALASENVRVPPWALRWVIAAYLAEKQIESAQALTPDLFSGAANENEQAMFYALLDSGQYDAAARYLQNLTQTTPYRRYVPGFPNPVPNDRWLEAKTLSLQYLLSTNALPEAQTLSRRLANTAPGNQGLRIDYARVLQACGLPQAAERELKKAEVLEPSSLELERQQAYVAQDLHEWRQMDLLTDDVMLRSSWDIGSQRLKRMRDVHRMSELRVNGQQGLHSDTPVSGAHDFSWDMAIYGPPVADSWRLFGGNRFNSGRFEEGKGSSRSMFGGIEWRPRNSWVELELANNNFNGGNKPGGRASAWHSFSDSWRVGGEVERLARATPLRALRNGVSANQANLWVRWHQNERREYQVTTATSWFSDHNHRQEYTFQGRERLWQTPRIALDLQPGVAYSSNSKTDTAYYSPKWDLSAAPTLAVNHVMYQRYDTVWSQQISAGAGVYRQRNYGAGAMTTLGYGQRIQWNNVLDTGAMLNWEKRPWDGKRETHLAVAFDANLRF